MSAQGSEGRGRLSEEGVRKIEDRRMQRQIQMDVERDMRWSREIGLTVLAVVILGLGAASAWWLRAEAQGIQTAPPVAVLGTSAPAAEGGQDYHQVVAPLDEVGDDGAAMPADEAFPPAIEAMRKKGAALVVLGEAEGLNGYLVRPPSGRPYAAYVTSTGGVVVGLLVGPEGEDVTRRQLEEARAAGKLEGFGPPARGEGAPAPGEDAGTRVGRLLQVTREAPGFWLGDRGPVIHTFADPTCPYSVEHVRGLARDARAGRLQAHVIPVGILGERAAQRAVEIAGAERPRDAWLAGAGGAVDRDVGAVSVGIGLRAHAGWRVRGVPFSVWEGPQGVQVFYGAADAVAFAGDVVR